MLGTGTDLPSLCAKREFAVLPAPEAYNGGYVGKPGNTLVDPPTSLARLCGQSADSGATVPPASTGHVLSEGLNVVSMPARKRVTWRKYFEMGIAVELAPETLHFTIRCFIKK
jgi:hypothetical protein